MDKSPHPTPSQRWTGQNWMLVIDVILLNDYFKYMLNLDQGTTKQSEESVKSTL